MTPQQQELNDRVGELPIIKDLQTKDNEIIEDLEGLRVGQERLHSFVQEGFSKGKDRMDGIEGEVKEVKNDVKELSRLIVSFFTEAKQMHAELKSEIQNGKIQELRNELQSRQKDEDKRSSFKSGLMIGLSVLAAGTVLSIIGFLVSKVIWP